MTDQCSEVLVELLLLQRGVPPELAAHIGWLVATVPNPSIPPGAGESDTGSESSVDWSEIEEREAEAMRNTEW